MNPFTVSLCIGQTHPSIHTHTHPCIHTPVKNHSTFVPNFVKGFDFKWTNERTSDPFIPTEALVRQTLALTNIKNIFRQNLTQKLYFFVVCLHFHFGIHPRSKLTVHRFFFFFFIFAVQMNGNFWWCKSAKKRKEFLLFSVSNFSDKK